MSTEALKSTPITNRDATPSVLNTAPFGGAGKLLEAIGYVTTTSGVTVGSTYRLVTIPTQARVSQILIYAAAMTQGPFDIGVYKCSADGGAVVDADFFATAVDCSSAVNGTDITNESATYTIAKQFQPIWQAVGVATADPLSYYDIVATSTNTITAGAALMLKVRYVL
jgi:hypothetical protein